MATPEARGRVLQLDVLRGVAILLVIGNHLVSSLPLTKVTAPIWYWHFAGWVGVDLFFVLSGFLVSGLIYQEYEKTGTFQARRFLIRRGLKIYPAFYAFILLTGLLMPASRYLARPTLTVWRDELFFLQNYGDRMWLHTWSLAVEEHFYLLLAVAALVLVRLKPSQAFRSIPRIFFVTATALLGLRVWTCLSSAGLATVNTERTHLRMDALLFGVLLAYWYHAHRDRTVAFVRTWKWPITAISCALLIPPVIWRHTFFGYTLGFMCLYVGFGGILLVAMSSQGPAGKRPASTTRLVAWIGTYSYSIYLWHLPVRVGARVIGEAVVGTGRLALGLEALAYVAGAICTGVVMARLIEFPVLHLRNRLFPAVARGPGHPQLDLTHHQGAAPVPEPSVV